MSTTNSASRLRSAKRQVALGGTDLIDDDVRAGALSSGVRGGLRRRSSYTLRSSSLISMRERGLLERDVGDAQLLARRSVRAARCEIPIWRQRWLSA